MFVGFQYGAFQYNFNAANPDTHDGAGGYRKHRHRKTIGNVEFIYEKARSLPRNKTKKLRDAIAPFVDPTIAREAIVPDLIKIDYAAMEANAAAYQRFASALEEIENNLGIVYQEMQSDEELILISFIACTIN